MGRIVAATWLPTLLFVIGTGVIAANVLGGFWTPMAGACALLLTPALWWWLVGRQATASIPRGLWTGVLVGIAPHLLAMVVYLAWYNHFLVVQHLQGARGLGAIGDVLYYISVLAGAGIGAVMGALLGIAVVSVARRRARDRA